MLLLPWRQSATVRIGGWTTGRQRCEAAITGPSLKSAMPASKLIHRLVDGDGGLQMPPTGALPDEEIGILRAWIDQGAEFRTEVKDEAPSRPIDPKLRELITAVRSGDTKSVTRLLEAAPELVSASDPDGNTCCIMPPGSASWPP